MPHLAVDDQTYRPVDVEYIGDVLATFCRLIRRKRCLRQQSETGILAKADSPIRRRVPTVDVILRRRQVGDDVIGKDVILAVCSGPCRGRFEQSIRRIGRIEKAVQVSRPDHFGDVVLNDRRAFKTLPTPDGARCVFFNTAIPHELIISGRNRSGRFDQPVVQIGKRVLENEPKPIRTPGNRPLGDRR